MPVKMTTRTALATLLALTVAITGEAARPTTTQAATATTRTR